MSDTKFVSQYFNLCKLKFKIQCMCSYSDRNYYVNRKSVWNYDKRNRPTTVTVLFHSNWSFVYFYPMSFQTNVSYQMVPWGIWNCELVDIWFLISVAFPDKFIHRIMEEINESLWNSYLVWQVMFFILLK